MPLPVPEPGLVIAFNYLWRREADLGHDNARYPRPCAIVLTLRREDGRLLVAVAPITHSPPQPGTRALRIPPRVKTHLGLDDAPSWIVTDELNEFVWPGFDLAPDAAGEIAYGFIPPRLFDELRELVLAAAREGRLGRVIR